VSILQVKQDNLADVLKSIKSLMKQEVLVGIPDATADRDDEGDKGPMNNAVLGYIHDNGSPAANIPARPFLRAGIEQDKEKIEARLKKAAKAALDGDASKAEQEMHATGLIGQNAVRNKINSGDFAPLSDRTLLNRMARPQGTGVRVGKGAEAEMKRREAGMSPGTGDAKPLIDTGQLRNSITYVVREK
jgi:phage gpG-like protein